MHKTQSQTTPKLNNNNNNKSLKQKIDQLDAIVELLQAN